MIFGLITIVILLLVLVLAGCWAATRLTIVGFGVTSAILAVALVLWTLLAGVEAELGFFGFGLWLVFNASFFLGGIALGAFRRRQDHWRTHPISIKDA